MKTKFFLIASFCMFYSLFLDAQNSVNVVHLKNGSMIKGVIIEQIPNESLKLKTYDGSIFVFKADEIEKITLEEKVEAPAVQAKPAEIVKPPVVETPKPVEQKVYKPLPLKYSASAVYQNGRKLTPTEIPLVLKDSPTAFRNYKQAEGLAFVSGASNLGFWVCAGVGILYAIQKKPDAALTMPVVGMGTFFVTQIVFSIAAKSKIKQAVETYNIDMKTLSQLQDNNLNIEMADNGIGFKIKF
jgi:hypothetical protein